MMNIEVVVKKKEEKTHSANIPYGFFMGRIDNGMYSSYRLFIKTQTATDNYTHMKDIIIGIGQSSEDDMPVWGTEDLYIFDYQKVDGVKIEVY